MSIVEENKESLIVDIQVPSARLQYLPQYLRQEAMDMQKQNGGKQVVYFE